MPELRRDNSKRPPANSFLLAQGLRTIGEQSESESPFVPFVGGPRMFVLLLYASVIVVTSIQYFVSQRIWFGSWDLYNTYVFVVTGVFVFLGMLMLFQSPREVVERPILRIPKQALEISGFLLLAASGLALVYFGKSLGVWAIPLSIALLYGFLMMLLGGRGFDSKEAARLTLYGTGLVVMIMVPVHESFGVLRSPEEDFYLFSPLNLVLFISGMTLALVAVQSLQTRDGFVGAWLQGAMAIFLIAFHEQIGIVASGTYSPYDRGLALIGITFSFLPLVMYFWRERLYVILWRRLREAQALTLAGDHEGALKHIDAVLRQCSRVGIEDRFALPWSLKADSLYRLKDFPKAMVHYDTALKIDPRDSTSWSHLGNMYALEGKHEEALRAFDQAVKVDATNGPAWNNRGVVLQTMGRYEEAIVSFDKALGLMEDPFDPHINLAKIFSRLGHTTDSLKHYQAALALRPKSEVANEGLQREFHRSKCLDQINGWEQLGLDTSYLRRLLEEDPRNFVKKSKEFLKSIADQRTPLEVVPAKEHMDLQSALKTIVSLTEGEGATIEQIEEYTGLRRKDLVLPLAILVEADKVHFRMDGGQQLYVSKGTPPERPPPPPKKPPVKAPERPVEQPAQPSAVTPPAREEPAAAPQRKVVPKVIEMHKPRTEAARPPEPPKPVEAVRPPPSHEPSAPPKPEAKAQEPEPLRPAEARKPAPPPKQEEKPTPPVLKAIEEQLERLSARAPPPLEVRIQERLEELDEDSSVACPICGLPVGIAVVKCPYCGAEFEEEPAPAEERAVPKPASPPPSPRPEPVLEVVEDEELPQVPETEKKVEKMRKKAPAPKPKPAPPPSRSPKKEAVEGRHEKKGIMGRLRGKSEKREKEVRQWKPVPKPEKKPPAKPSRKRQEKKPSSALTAPKAVSKPKPEEKMPPKRDVVKVEPTAGILFFVKKKKKKK